MNYYSLNKQSPVVDFATATLNGQAPDKGLYYPEYIPNLATNFIENIENYTKEEIAYTVIQPFVGNTIPTNELQKIVAETVNFSIPLVPIPSGIYALELYHGPTLAFKDIGAVFMARCLSYFLKNNTKKVTILVATSGDTGGAVANGFYNIEGINVVILYPKGKVSTVQEMQLTTLGNNITALEVDGNFDDCQAMVKAMFMEQELQQHTFLTSANSINVARWLPQQFYYYYAYQQWKHKGEPLVISVPSGNFGNICAGLIAKASGLPITHFVAACNSNDTVTQYLKTASYNPSATIATISNAMDVSNPSNFVRIANLYNQMHSTIVKDITSYSVSDTDTKATLLEVYKTYNYLLDPHGAVGYSALQQYMQHHNIANGIVLETAHPIKFYDVVEPIIGNKIELPPVIAAQMKKPKKAISMSTNNEHLKEYLLSLK